jgi:hypothetical protein
MSMKSIYTLAAGAVTLTLGTPAQAVLLNYSLTGDYTANWQFDSNQIPLDASEGFGIIYDAVKGSYAAPLSDIAEVCFFNDALGGGLQLNTIGTFDGVVSTAGPQLYSGSELKPTFLTGTFKFLGYDVVNEVADPSRSYTLKVSAAVPEPASWAMLIAGFGLIGGAMRRQKAASEKASIPVDVG